MLRSCVIAAILLAWTGSAGSGDPVMMRTVTMNGIVGAAYYSTVEQGYRFIGGTPRNHLAAAVAPIAVSSLEEAEKAAASDPSSMTMPTTDASDQNQAGGDDEDLQQGS
ncbi:hypothetical protein [Aurantimonas marianensis]|uniref:Uncharacterized protein n=1 Tax=Aurantimonas marianensis TaxID=2920428 RepID=A0A9X2H1P2_9HYPH|nr:hypothetical protein [Aurantimonas marianensis]MCP3053632.1 hypothetical protein [Aurantimonas marianensis]